MTAEILRTYTPKATYGDAFVFDDARKELFKFHTLELPWNDNHNNVSCIPEGTYNVHKMPPNPPKRPYHYFWVMNVPGRSSILWHPGNYTRQILGCILPGDSFKDLDQDGIVDIRNTTATLKKLTDLLPDIFKVTIKAK
jgi:hypothetical protein